MSIPAPHSSIPADQVRTEIRRRILDAAGDRVRTIYLHGSRAKGTARPRSDWDVVVVLREPVDDWIEASLCLAELFYDCPFAVDLQAFGADEFDADSAIPGTLAYSIARRGERLAEGARGTASGSSSSPICEN